MNASEAGYAARVELLDLVRDARVTSYAAGEHSRVVVPEVPP
jgi:hypothetical protein